jgi:hypothetical protein
VYISVESYYKNMIPYPDCYFGSDPASPKVTISVWQNDKLIGSIYQKPIHNPYYFKLSAEGDTYTYSAGDVITVRVDWDWER